MAHEPVSKIYDGKSVFLTGVTGFLGKVILEKLLYSCTGIEKVYVLVRDNSNEPANLRIQKLLEQTLFSRLREQNPESLKKVEAITGDITKPNLGIDAVQEQLLIDKVSIVLHVAATIKFNEVIETAFNINVAGTERVLNLCHRLKNIQAFVYMSTAFSNTTNRKIIEEVVYPAPASINEVREMIKAGISEDQVKGILNGWPNTYTFTKALAEKLVDDNHAHVPAVIVRPSIVCCCDVEPIVGWIDNWFGSTALLAAISRGVVKVLLGDPKNATDLIPVDYVSSLTIVAAAKCKSTKDVQVYNSATSGENPLTLGKIKELIKKESNSDVNLSPFFTLTKFKWLVTLITFLLQTIPACIADTFLFFRGAQPRFRKMNSKVISVRNNMEYFIANSWKIRATETKSLYDSLSLSDKRTFSFDPTNIDWSKYIPKYLNGIRTFLLTPKI